MECIRQTHINSLIFFLSEDEIITKDGHLIKFNVMGYSDHSTEGMFSINNVKEGSYQISFSQHLALLLKAKSDFSFKIKEYPSNSILLESKRNDCEAIVDLVKKLSIAV